MNVSDLITANQSLWQEYTQHRFVRQLGDGTLPDTAFRHYLIQDYLFLKHFARAYALAIYKCDSFSAMQRPLSALTGLLEHETSLHVAYCQEWGISEQDLENIEEDSGTVAYTRLVLDIGQSGSLTELYVALAPCALGYAEIGAWLPKQSFTARENNPYIAWIDMYAGETFQQLAVDETRSLDEMMKEISADSQQGRKLNRIFRDATRMEIAFWEQGLNKQ
ncbi:MAG: thiaminase II [Oceanospirillales bacterium LUC14_002_19_P2]|nr:MAG: thiaminase II [Oceanospirillales bacterium LUC14_002_19_P2]